MKQPKSTKKVRGVTIRFEGEEHETIKGAAKANKQSFNSFVVLSSLKAAKQTKVTQ